MKVAITSRANREDAAIDPRFGRCAYFAIYDTDTKAIQWLENSAKDAESGAGPAAVALIANEGVTKIISGEFGFKIKEMLNELKIQMVMLKEEKSIREITTLLNH